jgi:hypothetical protein
MANIISHPTRYRDSSKWLEILLAGDDERSMWIFVSRWSMDPRMMIFLLSPYQELRGAAALAIK